MIDVILNNTEEGSPTAAGGLSARRRRSKGMSQNLKKSISSMGRDTKN
jgi:hypothetical protein